MKKGKLLITVPNSIKVDEEFQFEINGIMNPNKGTTHKIDIITSYGNDIIDYTN